MFVYILYICVYIYIISVCVNHENYSTATARGSSQFILHATP